MRSEDRATLGFPAYALRQTGKFPQLTFAGKPKLLCFPHSSAARVLVLMREIRVDNPDPIDEFDPPWKVEGHKKLPGGWEHLPNFFPDGKIPRICSLSAKNDDMLLWAHYGDSHKGIAIEVEIDSSGDFVQEVIYRGSLKRVEEILLLLPALEPDYRILARKTKHWDYESQDIWFETRQSFSLLISR